MSGDLEEVAESFLSIGSDLTAKDAGTTQHSSKEGTADDRAPRRPGGSDDLPLYSLGRSVLDLDDVALSMAPTSVLTRQLANAAACHVAVQMAGVSRTAEMFVASQITQAATQNVAR